MKVSWEKELCLKETWKYTMQAYPCMSNANPSVNISPENNKTRKKVIIEIEAWKELLFLPWVAFFSVDGLVSISLEVGHENIRKQLHNMLQERYGSV